MGADIAGSQLTDQKSDIAVVQEFTVRNFPNPFNPETTVEICLPNASQTCIAVYNLLGQAVKILADQQLNPGVHRLRWDGRNEYGEAVPCDIYYLRVQTNEQVKVHRMLLLK